MLKGISAAVFLGVLSFYCYTKPDFFIDGFGKETFKAILFGLSIAVLALLIEAVCVGWKKSSARSFLSPTASQRRDIAVFFFDISRVWFLAGKLASAGVPFFIGAWLGQKASSFFDFRLIPHIPFAPLQVALHLLLSEFVGYWLHRTFHMTSFLWPLHEYHHSATSFNILTARRDHPLVVPLFSIFTGLLPAVLGVPTVDMYWIGVLMTLHAFLIHSQLQSSWGWIGRWLFVSPKGHMYHHSCDSRHFNKNFGFMTPFWDRVFGTFYMGTEAVIEIGASEKYYNRVPMYKELFLSCERSGQILVQKFKSMVRFQAQENSAKQ